MNRYRRVLSILMPMLFLSACAPVEQEPAYKEMVVLEYSSPEADARCSCKQSRAAFLHNTDSKNSRYVKTEVTVTLPSNNVNRFTRTDTVAPDSPNNPNSRLFIGCTIDPIGTPAACVQTNDFRKVDESSLRLSSSVPKGILASSPYFINDVQSCTALCSAGSMCYRLGKAGAGFAAPFIGLLEQADNTSESTIKKADLLQKYGMKESDDKCGRGDVIVEKSKKLLINEGKDHCEIRLFGDRKGKLPDDLEMFFPQKVVGERRSIEEFFGVKRVSAKDQVVDFSENGLGPAIGFTGPNGKELTEFYGGAVRSVTRLGDNVILSNTNGCMSVRFR